MGGGRRRRLETYRRPLFQTVDRVARVGKTFTPTNGKSPHFDRLVRVIVVLVVIVVAIVVHTIATITAIHTVVVVVKVAGIVVTATDIRLYREEGGYGE